MRIIAGEARGRQLYTPKNNDIRPTGDRVKGSIFNMIGSYIDDAVIIDLFAGTGNLGLEAISRGASKVYFIDKSSKSLEIVKKNIDVTGFKKYCHLIHGDFEKALANINEKVDVFFIDPPYNKGYITVCLKHITAYDMLSSNGIVVIEHSLKEKINDNLNRYGLDLFKQKKYGTTMVSIYRRSTNQEDSK